MDRLWKHLMQLDARALFFGSVALFVLVVILVAWLSLHHAAAESQPLKTTAPNAANTVCYTIGVLGIVSNQMSAEALVVPVNPFRPSIENMGASGRTGSTTNLAHVHPTTTNLFVGLRPAAPAGNNPAIPTLTFRGYIQRPDGTAAALFYDSVDGASHFSTPGSKIREASLVSVDIHTAKVQKPDGQTVALAIGDSFTLPAAKP